MEPNPTIGHVVRDTVSEPNSGRSSEKSSLAELDLTDIRIVEPPDRGFLIFGEDGWKPLTK